MHGALLRNHTGIGKISNRGNSPSTKSLDEVNEASFFILENTTKSAYITYMVFGLDGQCTRILYLPFECFDKLRGQIDMDGLCVVSPASIIPFSMNQPKYLRSIWHTYSSNPVAEANLSGYVRQRCSQQKTLATKCVEPNVSPCSCSMWSGITPGITNTTGLSENCKVPRRKPKKKAKKKKKQIKKLHSDAGLVEAEALSTPFSNGISTTETFVEDDMELDGIARTDDLVDSLSGIYDTQAVGGDHSCGISHLNKVSRNCLVDRHLDLSYQSGSQTFETEEFVHNEAARDTLRQQLNWFDCDTEVSYDNQEFCVSDSGFTGLNSGDSRDTICDVTNSNHFSSRDTSAFVGPKDSVSSESSSILSADLGTHTKGRKIGSKESSSSDVPTYTKRGNRMNWKPGRYGNKGTAHGRFGKENLHSVWKKVQKSDSSDLYSVDRNNNLSSEFNVTSREKPRHEGYCNVTKKLSAADDSSNFEVKVSRKPRNRIALESQQKVSCPSRKEYHPKKHRSSMHVMVNQENDRTINDAAQKKIKQARSSSSTSQLLSNSSRVALCTNKVNGTAPSSVSRMKVHPSDLLFPETIRTASDTMDAQNSEVKYSMPTESDGPLDLSSCLNQIKPGHPALEEDDISMEKEDPFGTNGKKDNNSGFVLQKWIPVGRKVPCPTGLERSDTSLLLHFDKPDTINGCCNTTTDLSGDSIPSIKSEIQGPSSIFEKLYDSEEGANEVKELTSETATMCDTKRKFGSLVDGANDVPISPCDVFLEKMTVAMEDTFRVQVESEAARAAIGTPIASFEKFMHSACPVILKLDTAFKCQLCHIEPPAFSFLCTHELPSLSLGSLWEWYERHGSYGLEVIEDRYGDPTKLGHHEFGSRAYFVPYLSAVQLFRKCRNGYVNGLKCLHPGIPRHCTDVVMTSPPYQSCSSHPCCESVDSDSIARSAVSTGSYELIFEYFESEQPQRRQPLFDKIKELTNGESLQQRVYGDPATLTSSDICDLHPRSWYSVAWYPIYRIPDGNFRAAFLTYHSLGHLAHREVSSKSSRVEVVSPIVGLLSCNAQCEGWFQPMDLKASDTARLSLSETIKERLKTLEHTATLLATSTVSKGDLTSVNRHPDYDFFTSRRR
ncbi:unnamed protein product [Rhodiola kirilowii]